MDNIEEKNPADRNGDTALHRAAKKGHIEVFTHIFKLTKDKNPENNAGITPLHIAAFLSNIPLCQLILENVDDKNPSNPDGGHTPLSIAAQNGNA